MKRLALLSLAFAALFSGCAGYQLGTTLPDHLRTVAVPAFINETGELDLESRITQATRQEFQRDGTLAVTDVEVADIIVKGKIISCDFAAVRYERGNHLASEEQRMTVRCDILATERVTGKTVFKGVLDGDTTFASTGDLTTAKRAAYRTVSQDVAHEVVNAVISAW